MQKNTLTLLTVTILQIPKFKRIQKKKLNLYSNTPQIYRKVGKD